MADPLENLADLVDQVDGENPTPEQREQQAEEGKQATEREKGAREWAMIPFTIGRTLAMLAPELQQIYTEQACLEWGEAADAVAVKYGWKAPAAPEFALVTMTINMAVPSVLAIRGRLQLLREGKEAGWFGKIVLWWRQRREGKAAAASAQLAGQAEGKPA